MDFNKATVVREFDLFGIKHVELKAVEHDTPVLMYESEYRLNMLLEKHGIKDEAMQFVRQYGADRVDEERID